MKCVAVFGGSGRIGEAIVRRLSLDNTVHLSYFSRHAEAKALARDLTSEGYNVFAHKVDVCDSEKVAEFLANAAEGQGLSGVVSANGALFPVCPLYEATEADLRRLVEIDVFGSFNILKHATNLMAATGGGSIAVILTAAILRTARLDGLSSIPKTALAGMIRQMARDAGHLNIRCNGIAPGIVDTEQVSDLSAMPPSTREMVEEFFEQTVLRRFTAPAAIAGLAAFLMSPEAQDISGQIIAADGGYSA